jgi:trimethylamine---corrinoid protein Co-methyltransferase
MIARASRLREALRLLSEPELSRVHSATLDLLENVGVRFTNPYVQDHWRQAGFAVDEAGLVRLRPYQVEEAIRRAPRCYSRFGKRRELDIHMGDGSFYMGTGSLPLYVIDAATLSRRRATREDMVRFGRLGDACPNLAIGNGQVKPSDVPDRVVHAIWNQNAVKNIAKPTCCWYALDVQTAQDTLAVLRAAAGSDAELRRLNTWAITICPDQALSWGDSAVGLVEMAKAGVPLEIMPMPFPGSMTPVTLAGTLVQLNAEILSCVVLAQALNPGVPVNYTIYGGIMDMRAATHTFGSAEVGLYGAAAAQLSRWYGLPSNVVTGVSDSKAPDAQAAGEKAISTLLIAIAGADSSSLLGGQLDFGLSASYEQLLIDDEIAGMILRIMHGFEVNEETLALASIADVGPGGQHLGTDHTLRHYRQEVWPRPLADVRSYETWAADGRKSAVERAGERVQELLAAYEPTPLSWERATAVDAVVRDICEREGVSYDAVAV